MDVIKKQKAMKTYHVGQELLQGGGKKMGQRKNTEANVCYWQHSGSGVRGEFTGK